LRPSAPLALAAALLSALPALADPAAKPACPEGQRPVTECTGKGLFVVLAACGGFDVADVRKGGPKGALLLSEKVKAQPAAQGKKGGPAVYSGAGLAVEVNWSVKPGEQGHRGALKAGKLSGPLTCKMVK
jgi:hypothetical protein